ncbi:MAG: sigma factor-like helix-turn-helix DNA-binding protein [Firmicutes bacterium]|nr:sigma factor-like helix-turn-helix DNA-binding protein [Bacillota bacterium]
MSDSEVADAIGIPVGTVKSRMYHARRELKEILEGGCKSCADANQ